jgi:hypothetical protein
VYTTISRSLNRRGGLGRGRYSSIGGNSIRTNVTDLISAVVELLGRDISRLVVEVREVLEPVELWDKR